MNSGCFELNRAYSVLFNPSNVGRFLWSWFLHDCIEVQKKKKKVSVWCSLSPQNVQWRQRNVQKSVMHVQSCYFVNHAQPTGFLPSSLPSPSSLHKLQIPIERFHMTSRQPYWCSKTMKRRPCWCSKPILWELNSFLVSKLSLFPINLHRCWPREWKRSIEPKGKWLNDRDNL